MAGESLLYLDRRDVRGLGIAVRDVVDAIESLLRQAAAGRAWNTPKTRILPGGGRLHMSMLASATDPPFMAVKSLGLNPANPGRGLETVGALVTLFDADGGAPLCVMDGDWITGARTAGLSATAALRLARADSETLAFVGCGAQARHHLEAFARLFPLKRVRALGRGAANRERLVAMARGMGLEAEDRGDAETALAGADLVVSSIPYTALEAPFLDADLMEPGCFAAMIDLARPWHAESLARIDRIVVDDAGQERAMADPMAAPERVAGDLADLATGAIPGRRHDDERIVFAFRGLALADLALAALCYARAVERGVGRRLER